VTTLVAAVIVPTVEAYTPPAIARTSSPVPSCGVASAASAPSAARTTPSRFAPDASVKTTCADPDAGFVRLTVARATAYAYCVLTVSCSESPEARLMTANVAETPMLPAAAASNVAASSTARAEVAVMVPTTW
jgi:hypothetical protein